jgi:hypothetical protein
MIGLSAIRTWKGSKPGRLQRADLRTFAGQQYHIVTSDLRSIAQILARHGTLPSRGFLMNILQGEAAALDALSAFCSSPGDD